MGKTITVKGIGKVKTAPDYIVVSIDLEAREYEYKDTVELAAGQIEELAEVLEKIGFEKNAVKTKNFNVSTDYDRIRDKNGNYTSVFKGYVCTHNLKVEFDMDTKRLAQTLGALSECGGCSEVSVAFTVKDPTAINTELLRSATVNAREKAQVLCEASGVELGELLTIDYSWGEINVVSSTKYNLTDEYIDEAVDCLADIRIDPDDINVRDTATFVWEIR